MNQEKCRAQSAYTFEKDDSQLVEALEEQVRSLELSLHESRSKEKELEEQKTEISNQLESFKNEQFEMMTFKNSVEVKSLSKKLQKAKEDQDEMLLEKYALKKKLEDVQELANKEISEVEIKTFKQIVNLEGSIESTRRDKENLSKRLHILT